MTAGRWDTWLYMPWRYRWTIGTGEEGGRFCRDYGINGGFTDHGEGPLDWLDRWNLRFYNDHTAGKGDLYLEPGDLPATGAAGCPGRPPPAARRGPRSRGCAETVAARSSATVRRAPGGWPTPSTTRSPGARSPARSPGGSTPTTRPTRAGSAATTEASAPARPAGSRRTTCCAQLGKPLREIDLSPFLDRMT